MVYGCDYNKTPHASSCNNTIAYFPPFTCRIRIQIVVNDNKFRTNDVMRNPKNHSPIWLFVTSNKVVRKPLSSFPCLPMQHLTIHIHIAYPNRIYYKLSYALTFTISIIISCPSGTNIACRQQLAPNWAQAHCAYIHGD